MHATFTVARPGELHPPRNTQRNNVRSSMRMRFSLESRTIPPCNAEVFPPRVPAQAVPSTGAQHVLHKLANFSHLHPYQRHLHPAASLSFPPHCLLQPWCTSSWAALHFPQPLAIAGWWPGEAACGREVNPRESAETCLPALKGNYWFCWSQVAPPCTSERHHKGVACSNHLRETSRNRSLLWSTASRHAPGSTCQLAKRTMCFENRG